MARTVQRATILAQQLLHIAVKRPAGRVCALILLRSRPVQQDHAGVTPVQG
jgi:hypothetical protein